MRISNSFYKYTNSYLYPPSISVKADILSDTENNDKELQLPNFYYMPVFTASAVAKYNPEKEKEAFLNMLKTVDLYRPEDDDIPAENYSGWDSDKIKLIKKQFTEYEDDGTLEDLLRAVNSSLFEEYIFEENNLYSLSNETTKNLYERVYSIDYDKWLHPSKTCEVRISIKDSGEKLKSIADNIVCDIELLRLTQAKDFIDRQLEPYIKKDTFTIPKKIYASKPMLYRFTDNIIKQLNTVWRRAKYHSNENQPIDVRELAYDVLDIRDDLKKSLSDINEVRRNGRGQNNFDITVKMWDRNPKKDLFQGNYSTCCIGMGAVNGDAMPKYLLHTCFNMIELVDNNTNNTIGNALCYFAEADGKLAFIIDNVEINKDYIPSKEAGNDIRSAILEYSKNLLEYIKKDDRNIDIYMSYRRNDIPAPKEYAVDKTFKFIGDIYSDIYLDLYDGEVFDNVGLNRELTACKLSGQNDKK